MNRLIFQCFDSENLPEYAQLSKTSVQAYAKKIKADYRIYINSFSYNSIMHPYYNIFYPFLFDDITYYDSICYIDSDILITKLAPDIFSYCNVPIVGCYNKHENIPIKLLNNFDNLFFKLKINANFNNIGINSGVVVFNQSIYKEFINWLKLHIKLYHEYQHNEYKMLWEWLGKYDQTIINLFIATNSTIISYHLNDKFNWRLNRFILTKRLEAYFIHYIGDRKHILKQDFSNKMILK